MAASLAAGLVRGRCARFTLLDACGNPQTAASSFVTEGVITVNTTKNVDAGDAISVRQMNGRIGQYEPGRSTVTGFTAAINLIRVNPAVIAMLTGDPVVLGPDGTTVVGWEERAMQALAQNFALEVWTDTAGTFCQGGSKVVGYMLYPMLGQTYVTVDNVADKEITCTINGMSYPNPQWGKGPYGGTTPSGVTPGPSNSGTATAPVQGRLGAAMAVDAHRHFELTPIAPPSPTAEATGPAPLVLPTPY